MVYVVILEFPNSTSNNNVENDRNSEQFKARHQEIKTKERN